MSGTPAHIDVARCAPLVAASVGAVLFCLWVRRSTWRSRWEVPTNLNVLLQGLGILFLSPASSAVIERPLYVLTGAHNVDDCLGDLCYVTAFCFMVAGTYKRLTDCRHIVRLVAPVCGITVPIIIVTFVISNASRIYASDNTEIPLDFWFKVYWIAVCGTLGYLVILQVHGLMILREFTAAARTANGYLFSCASVLMACITQIASTLLPVLHSIGHGRLVWLFVCGGAFGFAVTAARSWLDKVAWFSPKRKRYVTVESRLPDTPGSPCV